MQQVIEMVNRLVFAIKIRIIQNADVKNREVLKSSRIKGSIFHLSTLGI